MEWYTIIGGQDMFFYLLAVILLLLIVYTIRRQDEQRSKNPPKVELETDRLLLRQWTKDDAEDLFEYAKSELVGPSAGWPPHQSMEVSKEIIEHFIRENDVYAIALKATGKVIGSIGIHERFPDETLRHLKQREIGYVLNPAYWGNGYMPEAVEIVKLYCMNVLQTDIIWCGHFEGNMKSKRVIEKTGFTYKFTQETLLPNMNNKKVNTLFYSIEK